MLCLDVVCGHNKHGDIGVDLNRGECDVVADAEYLPFRSKVFDRILFYAVLEHLEPGHWEKALKEGERVAKDEAIFEIRIPVNAQILFVDIKKLFLEFPFSIMDVAHSQWVRHKVWGKLPGFPHKSHLRPKHISSILRIVEVKKTSSNPHSWFLGRKGRLLARMFGGRKMPGVHGVWDIKATKR